MLLKRYITAEIRVTMVSVVAVLMLIFTSQQFVRFLKDTVDGKITTDILLLMVGLQIPPLLGFLLPLGLFLGIMLAFGRMHVDQELTVARSCGVGNRQLATMVMPFALVCSLVGGVFSLYIAPWSVSHQQAALVRQDQQSEIQFLRPGQFNLSKDGRSVVYIAGPSVDANEPEAQGLGEFLFVQLPEEPSQPWRLMVAPQATTISESAKVGSDPLSQPQQWLQLTAGYEYLLPSDGLEWREMAFQQLTLPLKGADGSARKEKIKGIPSLTLISAATAEYWAELHWRLSVPISIPLLALLAIPLAKVQPRQGKFAKMLPALLIYLTYMILILSGRGLIEDGKVPGVIGLWWVHLLLASVVFWQYRQDFKRRSLMTNDKSRGRES